jgi:aminodeoxyfutalosine deaminase
VGDAGLLGETAARGVVLDVCPISNLRTGAVRSLERHPLPRLVGAGVQCSISTDDPRMFDTDLSREYAAATSLGLSPPVVSAAGLAGVLCEAPTRHKLRAVGEAFDWDAAG